jgi:zinc-ribbon domain
MAPTPPNNSGNSGNGAKADRVAPKSASTASARPSAPVSTGLEPPAPRPMIKCPKCGADARDVARFCPRCHMTLRYTCPACAHEQRHGGTCEKCGVDFVKYLGAVVSSEKAKSDVIHDRLQSRSNFLVNLLLIPVTGGLHLFKYLRPSSRKKNS